MANPPSNNRVNFLNSRGEIDDRFLPRQSSAARDALRKFYESFLVRDHEGDSSDEEESSDLQDASSSSSSKKDPMIDENEQAPDTPEEMEVSQSANERVHVENSDEMPENRPQDLSVTDELDSSLKCIYIDYESDGEMKIEPEDRDEEFEEDDCSLSGLPGYYSTSIEHGMTEEDSDSTLMTTGEDPVIESTASNSASTSVVTVKLKKCSVVLRDISERLVKAGTSEGKK